MIEHVWTVVCSRSVIDSESKNVTLQNVIERVTISEEPVASGVLPIELEVVTLWARADFDEPSRARARLTLLSPSGPVGDPFEYDLDLSRYHRTRTRTRVQGLPAGEAGRHVFRVELQNEGESTWHQVAAVPLEIRFEPPETEGTGE